MSVPNRVCDLLDILAVGDRKQVALSGEAAALVIGAPDLVPELIAALHHDNSIIVSHAAHALLTVFKKAAALLRPHGEALLGAYGLQQWEIKEQLAKILPFLPLTNGQRQILICRLEETLKGHKSGIARTCALQAITDLAKSDEAFRTAALAALDFASDQPSKALQARARKLKNSF